MLTAEELQAIRDRFSTSTNSVFAVVWEEYPYLEYRAYGQAISSVEQAKLDAAFFANARADMSRLLDEVERLRGIQPELPPRPPMGSDSDEGMPRYGLRWNGPKDPVSVPMPDGYWTPYYLAQYEVSLLRKDLDDACKQIQALTLELDTLRGSPQSVSKEDLHD
jgi:hypothetical protein